MESIGTEHVSITKLINVNTENNSQLSQLLKIIYDAYSRVYTELGIGHSEAIYQKALLSELNLYGLSIDTERNLNVTYVDSQNHKHIVGTERIDLFIHNDTLYREGNIILELKAIPKTIQDKEIYQLKKYFRELSKEGTDYSCGIIINFNQSNTVANANSNSKHSDFVIIYKERLN